MLPLIPYSLALATHFTTTAGKQHITKREGVATSFFGHNWPYLFPTHALIGFFCDAAPEGDGRDWLELSWESDAIFRRPLLPPPASWSQTRAAYGLRLGPRIDPHLFDTEKLNRKRLPWWTGRPEIREYSCPEDHKCVQGLTRDGDADILCKRIDDDGGVEKKKIGIDRTLYATVDRDEWLSRHELVPSRADRQQQQAAQREDEDGASTSGTAAIRPFDIVDEHTWMLWYDATLWPVHRPIEQPEDVNSEGPSSSNSARTSTSYVTASSTLS